MNFEKMLKDLLAVIHRDGGHYTDKHGVEKSVEDAIAEYHEIRQKAEEKNNGLRGI